MLYIFESYIVEAKEPQVNGTVLVEFKKRVNGKGGRLPSQRKVDCGKLKELIDFDFVRDKISESKR